MDGLSSPLLNSKNTAKDAGKPKRKYKAKTGRPVGAVSAHPAKLSTSVASQIIVILRALLLDQTNGLNPQQRFELAMQLAEYGKLFLASVALEESLKKDLTIPQTMIESEVGGNSDV